jgi:serine protease
MKKITKIFSFSVILSLLLFSVGVHAQTNFQIQRILRTEVDSVFMERLNAAPVLLTKAEFLADEIIVKFKGADKFTRVKLSVGEGIEQALSRYGSRFDVEYAEPNYIAYALFTPNDPYYSPYQWHFDNGVYGGIGMEEAWDISKGAGVTVAILDTGIAYENNGFWYKKAPDLAGTCFVSGYDFVNNDSHANDDEGHGTHVAGTVAQSTNNSEGVAGIAHEACLMPVKVLNSRGSGSYADIADGIRFAADNSAQVINLSLGGSSGSNTLRNALEYAYNKGVTIVAAAGNSNSNSLLYPAAYDEFVIAVGATRYDEARAPYSNYGAGLDLVAPGGDLSVDQNGDGYGDGVLQQTFGRRPTNFGYYFYEGTSMASPHVAGVAALVIANANATTPDTVRAVLEGSADDLGDVGHDQYYGWGLVNAYGALNYDGGSPPPPPPPPPPPTDDPPIVSITNPSNGATVSGNVNITADASDDNGVDRVEFYVNGGLLGLDSSAPYNFNWDSTSVVDGNHIISVIAFDTIDQIATSSISVEVNNISEPPPPPPPPGNVVFSDDFESGLNNWNETGEGDWTTKSPEEESVPGSSSGNQVAHADNCDSTCTITLSSSLDLSSYSSATLNLWRFIDKSLDRNEYLRAQVYNDSSWVTIAEWTHRSGDDDNWHEEQFDLSPYLVSNFNLRFITHMSSSGEDVELDDVVIEVN